MEKRNHTVDALRAFAALWVCLFHFTAATGIGAYGYLGVTIFFVISGFIVPYSMMRGGYTIAAWPTFMLKRLVRLEPPYLASIGLILALGAFDMLRGFPQEWTAAQIAGHLGYANAFLGLPWLNGPYWSLAVEFQFYILMGLALPLLMLARTPATRLAGLALASCLPLLVPGRSNATLLPFLPVFAAGTLTFLLATNRIGRKSYWRGARCPGRHSGQDERHRHCSRDRGHGGRDRHRSHSAGRCQSPGSARSPTRSICCMSLSAIASCI